MILSLETNTKNFISFISICLGLIIVITAMTIFMLNPKKENQLSDSNSLNNSINDTNNSIYVSDISVAFLPSNSFSKGISNNSRIISNSSTAKSSLSEKPNKPSNIPATAQIKNINGFPRLYVNGESIVPEMPFVNSDISLSSKVNISQIFKAANDGGIHLAMSNVSINPIENLDGEFGAARMETVLNNIIKGNPDGYIILRLWLGNTDMTNYPVGDKVKYADGSHGNQASIASDRWANEAAIALEACIKYIMSKPEYSSRVIGYLLTAAENGEWFQLAYREKGVDVSAANTNKFKEWAIKKYSNDLMRLRTSWGDNAITFENITVPLELGGKAYTTAPTYMLRDTPQLQKIVDYIDYYNEMTADRIISLSKVVKTVSQGRQLAGSFYGYTFELLNAFAGHYDLEKVLDSEYVDFLASPVSYQNRNDGGIGASMALVDSINAHNKMWFDESDYRSPIVTNKVAIGADVVPEIKTKEALIEVFRRQMGLQMLKGKGGWAMDLLARGWYDDSEFWREMGKLRNLYDVYEEIRPLSKPEVAYILDESGFALSADTNVNYQTLMCMRDEMHSAGINFGMYFLNDLENGLVPDAKLYLIACPYRITSESAQKLANELQKRGKTVVWMYGFGTTTPENIRKITGMTISKTNTQNKAKITVNNNGKNLILGLSNLIGCVGDKVTPVWKVNDLDITVKVLGLTSNLPSFAVKDINGSKQVFYGSYYMTAYEIKAFANYAGAHVFTKGTDMFVANENMIVMHTNTSGNKKITFPNKVSVYSQFEDKWYVDVSEVSFNAPAAKTYVFFYGAKSEIEALNLPKWK